MVTTILVYWQKFSEEDMSLWKTMKKLYCTILILFDRFFATNFSKSIFCYEFYFFLIFTFVIDYANLHITQSSAVRYICE